MHFFHALEKEIAKAKLLDKLVYIQLDANSKFGPQIIDGDPHPQSINGKILAGILNRNAMHVVNGIKEKCKGLITRRCITKKVREESIIDFVICCDEMIDIIEGMVIDEEKNFVLTKYRKTKKRIKIQESDHNSIVTNIKATWNKSKNIKRIEMYNLKDEEGLKKFHEMTNSDVFLSEVFGDKNKSIGVQTKHFLKRFGYCLSKCFKKIRIGKTKKNKELEDLMSIILI